MNYSQMLGILLKFSEFLLIIYSVKKKKKQRGQEFVSSGSCGKGGCYWLCINKLINAELLWENSHNVCYIQVTVCYITQKRFFKCTCTFVSLQIRQNSVNTQK